MAQKLIFVHLQNENFSFGVELFFDLITELKFLNVLLLKNEKFYIHNPFNSTITQLPSTSSATELFPDKLKDLYGYQYKTVHVSYYRAPIENGKIHGIDGMFLDEIVKNQNASYKLFVPKSLTEFAGLMKSVGDLTVTLGSYLPDYPHLYLYEDSGLCMMSLKAQESFSFIGIVTNPFSLGVWIALFGTIEATIFVLKFLKFPRSLMATRLMIYRGFSTISSIPKVKKIWNMIIQPTVFAYIVISNAYVSLLITHMSTITRYPDMNTLSDLKENGLKLLCSEKLKYMVADLKISNIVYEDHDTVMSFNESRVDEQHAVIFGCLTAQRVLEKPTSFVDGEPKYHLLEEILFRSNTHYLLGHRTPFREKFEFYILGAYQGKLHHYWKLMSTPGQFYENARRTELRDEALFLNVKSLRAVWIIYGVFSLISLAVFGAEVYYFKRWGSKKSKKSTNDNIELETMESKSCEQVGSLEVNEGAGPSQPKRLSIVIEEQNYSSDSEDFSDSD